MSEVARLSVAIEGKDINLSTLLDQLMAKLRQADQAAGAAGAGIGQKVGGGASQATSSVLSLASAEARLQATQGNLTGSAQILQNALDGQTQRTRQVIGVETQLAQVQNRLSGQSQSLTTLFQNQNAVISGLGQQFSQLGGTAGALSGSIGQLAGSMGTLGGIGAAIGIGKVGYEMASAGAQILATRDSFDNLAKSVGTTGDVMLAKMRAAADGTVTDAALIQSANSGMLLTSGRLAADLPHILEIARAAAKATGDDVGFVFNSLVTGIARGSPKVIDNAKITLDASAAFETYARKIGKSTDALTAADQQQATLNAVLLAGDDLIKKTGGTADSAAISYQKFSTSLQNAKDKASELLALNFAKPVGEIAQTITAITSLEQKMQAIPAGAVGVAASAAAWANPLHAINEYNAAVFRAGQSVLEATGVIQSSTPATAQLASVQQQGTGVTLAFGAAMDAERSAIGTAQIAAENKSNADALAAINAKTHQVAEDQLAAAAQAAAQKLLANGQEGAREAALLAGSSGQLDQRTAAEYRLAAAILARRNADNTASVGATVARQRTAGTGGRGDSSDADEGAAAAKARADEIRKALDNQILANGTNAEKIALANRNLREQIALHGADSAAAINAQTALDSAIASGQKKGKAAGVGKLSDQQKLNNSLLSQQDKFSNQTEDAETKHQQKLLDIAAQYAEKELAQEHQNEVSKLNSRADFYDRVTSSDLNKSKEGKTALSKIDADYEAAFAKSQQLAQEGKAKLGADYLALKQQQATQQLDFEEKVAAAKDKKDKAEVQRLQQIQKLRQQAQAEEEKQLLAGGDQNVNARDKALADESVSYQGSQDKIQTASDRATEHVIANAARQGKAIDQNTARYTSQAAAIDQTGQGANPQRPAQGTSTGVGATGAANVGASPPADAKAFSDLIDSLMSKLDEVKGAIVSAESDSAKQISGAIGRIKVSLVQ